MSVARSTTLMLGIIVLVGVVAFTFDASAQSPDSVPTEMVTIDDILIEVSVAHPGFGGFFLDPDDNAIAYVYMVDTNATTDAALAVEALLGQDRLEYLREIRVLQGDFDLVELGGWYQELWPLALAEDGVIRSDLDEGSNRIRIGVGDDRGRMAVTALMADLGIPADAVVIEHAGEIEQLSHTVESSFRPTVGGIRITSSGAALCTLGANGLRSGTQRGFITNSHCTQVMWSPSSPTTFYQPTSPSTIGTEAVDPAPFTGGVCPSGKACRWSDAAWIAYNTTQSYQGFVARTHSMGGSKLIDHNGPTFRITNSSGIPVVGEQLHMMGATSGWRTGNVTGTCFNYNLQTGPANRTMLCQDYLSSGMVASSGDSGAPIFRVLSWSPPYDIALIGILWGNNADTGDPFYQSKAFSRMPNIRIDLANSTTLHVCAPGFPSC